MKCNFCGERDGEVEIPNPNHDEKGNWLVCKMCEDTIENCKCASVECYIELKKDKKVDTKKIFPKWLG